MAIDIFVSYARDDDAVPADLPPNKGFVSFLCDQLVYEFTRVGPTRPRLWRDIERVEKGDDFALRFEEQLRTSSLILVILSRNWLARSWCSRELELFTQNWGGNCEAARRRVVFAAKHFIEIDSRPAAIQGQEGYKFFALDADEGDVVGKEREFFDRGAVRDQRYYERVGELGRYLYQLAKQSGINENAAATPSAVDSGATPRRAVAVRIVTAPPAPAAAADPPRRTIFVAQPAADMRQAYDRVVAEICGRGLAVVPEPDVDIPKNGSAIDFVDSALRQADLSVHLIGEKLGYAPEDAAPIVKLQLARAAAHLQTASGDSKPGKFHRLIWVAPPAAANGSGDGRTRDPLEVLSATDRQLDTDKVEGGGLSKFVDFLLQCIDRTERPAPVSVLPDANTTVYINHRLEDTEQAIQFAQALAQRQIQVIWPYFEGDPAELRAMHRENLREADSVLLCWARAPDLWVNKSAQELRNWRELGRIKRFACRLLIAAPPPGMSKKRLLTVPPQSDIDAVLDLTACDAPPPNWSDALVSTSNSNAP